MPIEDKEFGELLGIVKGMDKKLDDVTEHFIDHAKDDNRRFASLSETIITNKTRLNTWGSIVAALVVIGVAVLGYLIK
jgi:hypothetical protein